MFKLLAVLLAFDSVYCGFSTIKDVYYKYDALFDGFWSLPKTASEDRRFQYVATDKELNCDIYSHINDPRFFILFDYYGNVAGVRIGYIKSDLPKRAEKKKKTFPYKFEDHKMFDVGTFWDTDIFYTTILFHDIEVLKKGGRKETNGIAVTNIYLKIKGVWTNISRDQCDAEKMGFTKQGCFVGMGMHYFYNMTKGLDCQDAEGMFLLYESGELVGLGVVPFGSFTPGIYRNWFEDPPISVVKTIVPHGPKCLTEWISDYGATSLHIYFKKNPRFIACVWPFQKRLNCKKKHKTINSIAQ